MGESRDNTEICRAYGGAVCSLVVQLCYSNTVPRGGAKRPAKTNEAGSGVYIE